MKPSPKLGQPSNGRVVEPRVFVAKGLRRSSESHLYPALFQDASAALKFYRIYSFSHQVSQQIFTKCSLHAGKRTQTKTQCLPELTF